MNASDRNHGSSSSSNSARPRQTAASPKAGSTRRPSTAITPPIWGGDRPASSATRVATCWRSAAEPGSTRVAFRPACAAAHLVAKRYPATSHLASIDGWRAQSRLANLRAPQRVDLTEPRLDLARRRAQRGRSRPCSASTSCIFRLGARRKTSSAGAGRVARGRTDGCSSTARSSATARTPRRATPPFDATLRGGKSAIGACATSRSERARARPPG